MDVIHTPHTFNTPTLKYPTSLRNTTSYKTTRTNRMGLLHKRKIIKNMDNCSKNLPRKKIYIKMATFMHQSHHCSNPKDMGNTQHTEIWY